METWEAAHITKNLASLIKTTRCSAVLKAVLKAKELLSDEEDQRLTALGRNEGAISEAKLLYEIMMTKLKGYTGLMEVLRDTRQDVALKILLEGLQHPESHVPSAHRITQLLNMRVQLGNCTKQFNDVFPNFTREDAKDLVQNGDLKQELDEIFLNGSLEIQLDAGLPVTFGMYIPRLLSNRLQLDPRVFTLHSCEDVFVFKNIPRTELAQLVKPHATRSSTNQRSHITGRHIYLDDDEDWEDMVAISESPVHLVSKEDGGYILQRTTKVTDVLQKNVLREGRSTEAFVKEDVLVEELISDNDSNGALICDLAGTGKTWLMQSLVAKIRDNGGNFVVFFIDLSSYSKFLSILDQPTADEQALMMVLNFVCPSKLVRHLLHKYAAKNGLKVAFVLDGYDEISQEDIKIIKPILFVLSKLDNIRMIVSSRPIMRSILQKTFNLIAYDILPFQTDEQKHCIAKHWANVCPQIDSESYKLEEFALKCIQSVKFIRKDDSRDILGLPLMCRLLATVNEKQAKQLCKAKRRKPFEIVEAATIKSVFDLYTKFVDTLIDKVAEAMPLDARNNFADGVLVFFTHMALELLFPDLSNVYLQNYKIDSSMEELYSRVGVACVNNAKHRLEFIHRSFAEYFVGRFFAEFWNDIDQYSPSFVQTVGSYFITIGLVTVNGTWMGNDGPFKQNSFVEIMYRTLSKFQLDENSENCQLKYYLIRMFMNQKLNQLQFERSVCKFRNLMASNATEAIITTKTVHQVGSNSKYDQPCKLKKWLAETSFVTMIACIEDRLTNVFSLYIHILISFFDLEDRVQLLLPSVNTVPSYNTIEIETIGIRECVAWLLCYVAMSESLENAVELFNLFGNSEKNYLTLVCQRYPEEYWSPLEVAILTRDVDMTLYFVDKVNLPVGRLFITCVAIGLREELIDLDVDVKLKITKMVLGSSERVLDFLCTDNLCIYEEQANDITKYSFQLLLKFLYESKRSINSITVENKTFFLQHCSYECNDEETINLLLTLYGKSDDRKRVILNLVQNQTFTADDVLHALDMVEIRNAFSKLCWHFKAYLAYSNCLNLETLKVLTGIQPDFRCCNEDEWNYLHVAASRLQIDWVKHLLNSGCEVDQPDGCGRTPLLCAYANSRKKLKLLLAVTRLLVVNGAKVDAKDRNGQNIAHYLFFYQHESKDLCEWISFMLENGYHQLWEMRDERGNRPQDILIIVAGRNSPITTEVLKLLESYSVVSTN